METPEKTTQQINSSVPIPWLDAETFYAIYQELHDDTNDLPKEMRNWIEAYESIRPRKLRDVLPDRRNL